MLILILLELLVFINLCAFFTLFDIFLDEKAGSAENKNTKDEASSNATPGPGTGFPPGTGFQANPFDFSAMSGLLNVSYFLLLLFALYVWGLLSSLIINPVNCY